MLPALPFSECAERCTSWMSPAAQAFRTLGRAARDGQQRRRQQDEPGELRGSHWKVRHYNLRITSAPTTVSAYLPQLSTASRGLFSAGEYARVRDFFAARPELVPTPLRRLDQTADRLGLASVTAKDETARFGLNAFKLVGARFAIEHLIATGRLGPGDTVICASEGNHGRAVARAAREALTEMAGRLRQARQRAQTLMPSGARPARPTVRQLTAERVLHRQIGRAHV